MSSLKQISKNYAQALSESISDDLAQKETILEEIKTINASFNQTKNSWDIFNNPAISQGEKKELLKKLFNGKINLKLQNFLSLLIDKNRFNLLSEIQDELIKIINKLNNVVVAEVESASEIDEATMESLKQRLKELKNEKVTIETKINPELIGGLVVKINDLIYDGSIKGKLEGLKRRLG